MHKFQYVGITTLVRPTDLFSKTYLFLITNQSEFVISGLVRRNGGFKLAEQEVSKFIRHVKVDL